MLPAVTLTIQIGQSIIHFCMAHTGREIQRIERHLYLHRHIFKP